MRRRGYLSTDYASDIWLIGFIILHLSLFWDWTLHLSTWSADNNYECQVTRPGFGWKALMTFGNQMLNPDVQKRPTVTDCSENLPRLTPESSSRRPMVDNLYFLECHKEKLRLLPGVMAKHIPLLSSITVASDSDVAIVPFDHLYQILSTEYKEMDVLLRGEIYEMNEQKYVVFEDVIKFLESSKPTASCMTTTWSLKRLFELVSTLHLSKIG